MAASSIICILNKIKNFFATRNPRCLRYEWRPTKNIGGTRFRTRSTCAYFELIFSFSLYFDIIADCINNGDETPDEKKSSGKILFNFSDGAG